jgi:hypothetical protein
MKFIYCSRCNTRLPLIKIVSKKYSQILDTVVPHICPEVPINLSVYFDPATVPAFSDEKIVQKSNDLRYPPLGMGDRRPTENFRKEITSSAPNQLIDQMKSMIGTSPMHDIDKDPPNE